MIIAGKIVLGLVAAGAMGTAGFVALSPAPSTNTATVTRVIDGDTIDVSIAGQATRIRLLNIDTPETKDPERPVECLGPEAAQYLSGLLPGGTTVRLEYDEKRTDQYERTLAAVFTTDGTMINAEIARQGLAAVLIVDGNDRFYPPIAAAHDDAATAGRGLFSAAIECTLPGQVKAATATADALTTPNAAASSAEFDSAADTAAAAATRTTALIQVFLGTHLDAVWSAITTEERSRLGALVRNAHEKATRTEREARSAATTARTREAVEAAERDRLAREETARQQAEHQAREEAAREQQAAREQRAREAEQRRSAPDPVPPPASKPRANNPYPGYTGPRCYDPGGITWKPC